MTSQVKYLIAQQRLAEVVSGTEQARRAGEARLARSASAPHRDPTQPDGRSPSLAPATLPECTQTPHTRPGRVDPKERDDQVEEIYDRGFATEQPRPAPPHASPLAETLGYPPLCPHGMNSLLDRGYGLALGRLRRG